jgi:hypothetical protein
MVAFFPERFYYFVEFATILLGDHQQHAVDVQQGFFADETHYVFLVRVVLEKHVFQLLKYGYAVIFLGDIHLLYLLASIAGRC